MKFEFEVFCFLETLRLHTPIGMLFRCAKEDYLIPGTNITIEEGVKIMIPIGAIHQDSR